MTYEDKASYGSSPPCTRQRIRKSASCLLVFFAKETHKYRALFQKRPTFIELPRIFWRKDEKATPLHVWGVPRTVLEKVSYSRTGTWPVEPLRGGCRKQLADTQPPLQPHFLVQYNRGFTTMWLQLNHGNGKIAICISKTATHSCLDDDISVFLGIASVKETTFSTRQ